MQLPGRTPKTEECLASHEMGGCSLFIICIGISH